MNLTRICFFKPANEEVNLVEIDYVMNAHHTLLKMFASQSHREIFEPTDGELGIEIERNGRRIDVRWNNLDIGKPTSGMSNFSKIVSFIDECHQELVRIEKAEQKFRAYCAEIGSIAPHD